MLPFLRLPIVLPGGEGKNDIEKEGMFLPETFDAYHPGAYWGVFVYIRGGQPFLLNMTIEQFEAALKGYWEDVTRKAKIANSMKIIRR